MSASGNFSCCASTSLRDIGASSITVDRSIIACNVCTRTLDVSNTLVVNNIPITGCVEYPLALSAAACTTLEPGFCSSILQYINGQWGIFRPPGMTEITVGSIDSNFVNVTSALNAAPCSHFLRVTADMTENGPINTPPNTLIYVDPGVTWTIVGGGIQTQGDLILLGNININSSTISFQNLSGIPCISGPGALDIRHMHLDHSVQVSNSEHIFPVTKRAHLESCRITLGSASGLLFEDGKVSQVNDIVMNNVVLEGANGATPSNAISLVNQQNPYRFVMNNITIRGSWSTVADIMSITTSFNLFTNWIFQTTTSPVSLRLGGQVTNINNVTNTTTQLDISLNGSGGQYRGFTNIRNLTVNNTNVSLTDCRCLNLTINTAGLLSFLTNCQCDLMVISASDCIVSNCNVLAGNLTLNFPNARSTLLSNVRVSGLNQNINLGLCNRVQVVNCQVAPAVVGGTGTITNIAANTLITNCIVDGVAPVGPTIVNVISV